MSSMKQGHADLTFFYVIIGFILFGALMNVFPASANAYRDSGRSEMKNSLRSDQFFENRSMFSFHSDLSDHIRDQMERRLERLRGRLAGFPFGLDHARVTICHIPPGNPDAAQTITVGAPAAHAHIAHGDTRGACEEPTDEQKPVISNLRSEQVGTSTALIAWNTNEPADSTVYVSTSSPVETTTAIKIEESATTTSHSLSVTGLEPSTTHYYTAVSTDEAGNTATSSEQSFTTEALVDNTAPIITNVTASSSASTTASVGWNTNEPADSTVYYGTSSPISLDTFVHQSTSTLSHLLDLVGLAASTTYHYFVTSTDEAGNTATSSEETFITPSP